MCVFFFFFKGGSLPSILQQAQLMIISTSLCSSSQMYGTIIKPSMICAGYIEGKIDSCQVSFMHFVHLKIFVKGIKI